MTKLIILMIGFIIGAILGEHKACIQLNGKYSWDYGTCKLENK
jgi:hypothetical protein